jgi:hypothetical protein
LLVIILLPFGYFAGKAVLKGAVESRVQRVLNHSGLSVAGLDVGWGRILLNGIVLAQDGGDPICVRQVLLKFKPESLAKGTLALNQVVMDSPHVRVGKEGLDVSVLMKKLFPEDLARLEEAAFSLSSAQVFVNNGSADIVDDQVQPEPVVMRLEQMDLKVKGLGYPSAETASVQLSGRIEGVAEHGRIVGQGEVNPAEERLSLHIRLEGIDILALLPYYADQVSATVEGGMMDVEMDLGLADGVLRISGKFMLHGLEFADAEGFFFGIPVDLLGPYAEQELGIPFEIAGPVNAGRKYFHDSLLREFERGLLEQVSVPLGDG